MVTWGGFFPYWFVYGSPNLHLWSYQNRSPYVRHCTGEDGKPNIRRIKLPLAASSSYSYNVGVS